MTSLNFQLRISLLFFVRLCHNLVREIWVVHVTLRSYKISCDLEGHLDLWDQGQGQCIFFHYCLIFSIHASANSWLSHFKFSTGGCWKKESVWGGITSLIYLNWNLFVIYCRFEIKFFFGKSRWGWLCIVKITFLSLPVSQTWRH